MRHTVTLVAVVLAVVFAGSAQAQVIDADNIIMRVRTVCNTGQGGTLIAAFDIRPLSNDWAPPYGRIGGFCSVFTFTSSKLVLQGVQQRYQTGYWGSPYRSEAFGPSAWLNMHAHTGNPNSALPVESTYFTPSLDCQGNPLNDKFYEIMRYTMNIMPTASGTVTLGLYDVRPYATIPYPTSGLVHMSAVFKADLGWNMNDSLQIVQGLVIPVELSAFNVTGRPDGSMLLGWHTATETSNLGFEIERGDGVNFEKVGFVPGHGTTTEEHTYTWVDENPVAANNENLVYYRLKQVDTDGTFAYSEIQSAEIQPSYIGLEQLYPSPVRVGTATNVPYTLAVPGTVHMYVFNAMGQRVATLSDGESHQPGRHVVAWDGRSDRGDILPAGMYFLRFTAGIGNGEEISANQQIALIR
ncbi:MAG: hypothetical protein C0600_13050 [Ignavibacteria bacterium]|nr:MAG: hypothetical protein C0600_13050 [Ignavibacteria bacterium]